MRAWVGLLALATAGGLARPAAGQAYNAVPGTPYFMQRTTNVEYVSCPNPTVLTRAADNNAFDVNIPFGFRYFDRAERTLTVSTNAALSLPRTDVPIVAWSANGAPGTVTVPNGVIAPWWDDNELFLSNVGYVGYSVIGAAPRRVLCVEWKNLSKDNLGSLSNHRMTMRVLLHEGRSGRIDVQYGTTTGAPGAVVSASVGLEDQAGERYASWVPTSGSCGTQRDACREDVLRDLQKTRITFVQDAGRELRALGVEPPAVGYLDTPLQVPVSLQNLHAAPQGPFQVRVSAAKDALMTNRVTVGTMQVSLTGFERRDASLPVTVPSALGEGSVWFELEVDSTNAIAEVDEADNRIVSTAAARFVRAAPDLEVVRVVADQTELRAGQTAAVSLRVINHGSVAVTDAPVAVMLSTNPAIGPMDLELDRVTVTVGPGETVEATSASMLPAGTRSGVYHLGALADPDGTLDELSESNNGRAALEPVRVFGAGLSVATAALPRGFASEPYTARLVASGGAAPYRWKVVEGQLPGGLSLQDSSGEIFGRPTRTETQRFTVEVSTPSGESARRALSLSVGSRGTPLTIVTREVAPAVVGTSYAFALVVTGGSGDDPLEWSQTGAPPGFTVTPQGILQGDPSRSGAFEVRLQVDDGLETAVRTIGFDVVDGAPLRIVPAVPSTAFFGTPYQEQLEAIGGVPPVTWLLLQGSLPEGLVLEPLGEISGTPTEVGRFPVLIQARDTAAGGSSTRDVTMLEIEVVDDGSFGIFTRSLPPAYVGERYDFPIEATGGTPPYRWSIVEGRLPQGLLPIAPNNRLELRLVGTPSAPAVETILVEARDRLGRVARGALVVEVRVPGASGAPAPPVEPSSCANLAGRSGGTSALWLLALGLGLRRRQAKGPSRRRARARPPAA